MLMLFDFNFYSSLLLIFFVHTIVYAGLFFHRYRRQQQPAALWMAFFLLAAALYIAPWMLGFAGWYDAQPYRDLLFYIPFQQLFLLGPLVFFYVSSVFHPRFRLRGRWWLHLLPAGLYLLYSLVAWVYDCCWQHGYYFLASELDPDFDTWYQLTGFLHMIVYFVAALRYYDRYRRAVEAVLSNAADWLFSWIRHFLFAFLLILVARFVLGLIGLFYEVDYGGTWWYFLGFALCIYYVAIAGYTHAAVSRVILPAGFFVPRQEFYLQAAPRPMLAEEQLLLEEIVLAPDEGGGGEDYADWKGRVEVLLEGEQLYREAELSLPDLARALGSNVSLLSRVINRAFGCNFNDLINRYRVAAFIRMLEAGAHRQQTLLALAYECGFNSKTTFNRAFRKQTGCSPQQYIGRHAL